MGRQVRGAAVSLSYNTAAAVAGLGPGLCSLAGAGPRTKRVGSSTGWLACDGDAAGTLGTRERRTPTYPSPSPGFEGQARVPKPQHSLYIELCPSSGEEGLREEAKVLFNGPVILGVRDVSFERGGMVPVAKRPLSGRMATAAAPLGRPAVRGVLRHGLRPRLRLRHGHHAVAVLPAALRRRRTRGRPPHPAPLLKWRRMAPSSHFQAIVLLFL